MRILLYLLLLLLGGLCACPADPGNQSRPGSTGSPEQESSASIDKYGQQAVDYLKASLREPGSADHASLEDCWSIISRLPDASPFARQIEQQVTTAAPALEFELLDAWVATNPQAALEYVRAQCAEGNPAVLQALIRHPQEGLGLLLELNLSNQSVDFNDATLLLIRSWGTPDQQLLPVFQALATSADPNISLRAIGYLVQLDAASDEQLEQLKQAIRSETEHFMAAVEGGKISRSEQLATAYIPRVKDAPLGEADPELGWDMQPYFSAYALAYIPGTEARLIRTRLMDAANLDLRWQARFGELMQGHPASFQQAMLSEGVLSPFVLKCLAPPEAMHPDLLPWYEKAIAQAPEAQRFQLVSQLSRYNEHASDSALRELVLGLLDEDSSRVRGQAWLLAAQFGYTGRRVEAAGLLASETEQAPLKAAVACYLLSVPGSQQESGS